MHIHVFDSPEQVIEEVAECVTNLIGDAVRLNGRCNFALSGGSSPKKLYELLASPRYNSRINWSSIYFFFGDERFVPFDHPDSNGLMAKKALFDPLNINESQIFYIDTNVSPEAAAAQYQQRVIEHFENEHPVFDIILLGLGDNAHTASLFPHTPVLHEKTLLVSQVYLQEQDTYRITFTAPLINAARSVLFLVYGAGKAAAVNSVINGDANIEEYPAQLIKSANVHWFLDAAAASKL